eukprot:363169-Chlamydomonas_euryale.AAC.4
MGGADGMLQKRHARLQAEALYSHLAPFSEASIGGAGRGGSSFKNLDGRMRAAPVLAASSAFAAAGLRGRLLDGAEVSWTPACGDPGCVCEPACELHACDAT